MASNPRMRTDSLGVHLPHTEGTESDLGDSLSIFLQGFSMWARDRGFRIPRELVTQIPGPHGLCSEPAVQVALWKHRPTHRLSFLPSTRPSPSDELAMSALFPGASTPRGPVLTCPRCLLPGPAPSFPTSACLLCWLWTPFAERPPLDTAALTTA